MTDYRHILSSDSTQFEGTSRGTLAQMRKVAAKAARGLCSTRLTLARLQLFVEGKMPETTVAEGLGEIAEAIEAVRHELASHYTNIVRPIRYGVNDALGDWEPEDFADCVDSVRVWLVDSSQFDDVDRYIYPADEEAVGIYEGDEVVVFGEYTGTAVSISDGDDTHIISFPPDVACALLRHIKDNDLEKLVWSVV